MKKNPFRFFTEKECTLIEEAVNFVEKKTSGELVVMAVSASGAYTGAYGLLAFILGSLMSVILVNVIPAFLSMDFMSSLLKQPFDLRDEFRYVLNFGILPLLTLQVVSGSLLYFLLRKISLISALLIPDDVRRANIKTKAMQEFYSRSLHDTRDKTGLLILFSKAERMVYILADSGICEKISGSDLDLYAAEITSFIKKGNKTEGLIRVLGRIQAVLEEHFPIKPDDVNELSNKVVQEWY